MDVCLASDWRSSINAKLDALSLQLNDGCSVEVKDARKLYDFKNPEQELFASLISLEGQHCGNGSIEYLVIYRLGYERPATKEAKQVETYSLIALQIVGGRGERSVDFDSLKLNGNVFTLTARAYRNDPMCCPSLPVVLKYKLSFYGLRKL
jgi:hypothetical protein